MSLFKFVFLYFKVQTEIFPPTTGGAEQMCYEMNVKFLGKIPLDPLIGMN